MSLVNAAYISSTESNVIIIRPFFRDFLTINLVVYHSHINDDDHIKLSTYIIAERRVDDEL